MPGTCVSTLRADAKPAATAANSEHSTRPSKRLRPPRPSILAPSPSSLVVNEREQLEIPGARN
eukprot:11998627-Alexandrium_andersonii.AAC.1